MSAFLKLLGRNEPTITVIGHSGAHHDTLADQEMSMFGTVIPRGWPLPIQLQPGVCLDLTGW